jgi:ABC-2 type transport system permease protein
MRKILTIAFREYKAMVGTKAFLLSIVMMPILMFGSVFVMSLVQNRGEIKTRKIAIIDRVGSFYDVLATAASLRNKQLDDQLADGKNANPSQAFGVIPERYVLEKITPSVEAQKQIAELSDRVRKQDLYAVVEIPKAIEVILRHKLTNDSSPSKDYSASQASIRFYSEESGLADAKRWVGNLINREIRNRRLENEDIDPAKVAQASANVPISGMGLVNRTTSGGIVAASIQTDPIQAIFVPLGVMILMFAVIFMAAQPMLESVLEEKSQRIAEVLLGSVNSFQLMTGKLLGTVSGSLTVFLIYSAGMLGLAIYNGTVDQLPLELAPWFLVFQILGVLFYSAIFLAIGASVSQLKEAQALLLPVWLLMMSPMFAWLLLVRDPLGDTSTLVSLFPPATPTAMMLRMATGRSIPWWQPTLGALLLAVCTLCVVFFAARIFRTGILWQGKTPKISDILRWGLRG